MPTFHGAINDKQIVFYAAISIGSPTSHRTEPVSYKALLDTGAQCTLISKKVVDEIGLTSIGSAWITPATGKPIPTEKYRVRVDIPI